MEKIFDFDEIVTFHHFIEVDVAREQEEEFDELSEEIAEKIIRGGYDSLDDIVSEFYEKFGHENVRFIEDASPDGKFEAL